MPACVGCHALKQIAQHRERAEHLIVPHLEGLVPLTSPGDHGRVADDSVSQEAVVGVYVARGVNGRKPRVQHLGAHAHAISYSLPNRHESTLVERHHHSEAHHVHDHPVGRKIMLVAILVVEALGERLATPGTSVGVMAFAIIKISNCSGLYLSKMQ